MEKSELRRHMRRLNRAVAPDARAAAGVELIRAAERLPAFAAARTVALFCSLADEPDTGPALARWSDRKRIVVPRVAGDAMEYFVYDPATLTTGAFGIAEPGPEAEACAPGRIDLMLVPGVAFTREGLRLGRGGGYYDRYLAQPGVHALRVGICYRHQLVDSLPAEPHDVAMDAVIPL